MTDEMASDWLAAALGECLHLTDGQFKRGCAAARRESTHHAQIIPAIIKSAGESVDTSDRYLADWDKSLLDYQRGYPAITNRRSAAIGGRIAGYIQNIQIKEEF
jgi:hypothetical protein